MQTIRDVIQFLESVAPLSYQESYDNSGLLTGNASDKVTGVITTLDCTEAIVEEAIQKKANLIVAHHPILFSPLKQITGKNYIEKTIIKAIKNNIAIYAIHTNLDSVSNGVNMKFAEKLKLTNYKILVPSAEKLEKLTVYVPESHKDKLLSELWTLGAGEIGNYKSCSFAVEGTGSYQPMKDAVPFSGKIGEISYEKEVRIELLIFKHQINKIIETIKSHHPYEEVAYYLVPIDNLHQEIGHGVIGQLPHSMSSDDFLAYVKEKMSLEMIRHTDLIDKKISKVAICGGSGSQFLKYAIAQKADAYITADFKYHEFFDAEKKLLLCDIGHYESEIATKDLLKDIINQKFTNFATCVSITDTNPVRYYYKK